MTDPTPNTLPARKTIIRTAVKLIAEQGADGVSMNEIVRQSGQRNASALQYHFGNKAGLIQAIFDHFTPIIEKDRQKMIDEMVKSLGGGRPTLEQVSAIAVVPLTNQLDSTEGGRDYLQFIARMHNHDLDPNIQHDKRHNQSLEVLKTIAEDVVGKMPNGIMERRRAIASALVRQSLADYCLQCPAGSPQDKEQRGDMVNTLVAGLVSIFSSQVK